MNDSLVFSAWKFEHVTPLLNDLRSRVGGAWRREKTAISADSLAVSVVWDLNSYNGHKFTTKDCYGSTGLWATEIC